MNPVAKHRRDVWLMIVLPMTLTAGVLILVILGLLSLNLTGTWEDYQVTTAASVLGVICFLLPMAIVLGIVTIALAYLLSLNDRLIGGTTPVLRSVREKIEKVTGWLPPLAEKLVQPLIALDTRLTRWEQFIIRMVKKEP